MVAVTGAFGALGRRLIARLEEDPTIDRIVAIDVRSGLSLLEDGNDDDHATVLLKHPKLSAHTVDLTTPGTDRELADLLRGEGAGSLFHLALLSTPTHHQEMAHELETVGTHYVLNATASAGITRLVMLSSTMCYGARPDNPAFLTEDHPLRPPPSRALKDKADADAAAAVVKNMLKEWAETFCVGRLVKLTKTGPHQNRFALVIARPSDDGTLRVRLFQENVGCLLACFGCRISESSAGGSRCLGPA